MYENLKNRICLIKNWHIICMLIISFIFSLVFYSPTLFGDFYNVEGDTFLFRTIGREIANGKILYKEIFDHKGPIIFLLNSLFYIFRYINLSFWFSFLCTFVTLYYVYKISSLMLDGRKSYIIVLIFLGFQIFAPNNGLCFPYNMTESYMMPITAFSYYYFLKDDYGGKIAIIMGILTTIVFNMRLNMLSIIFILLLIYLIKRIIKKDYKTILNFIVRYLVGIIISFLPLIYYLLKNNILNEYIYASLIYNIQYSDISTSQKIETLIDFLCNPYILLIFIIYIVDMIKNIKEKKSFDCNFIIFIFCFIMNVGISGRFYGHYLLPIVPMISFPLSNIFSYEGKNIFNYISRLLFILSIVFSIGVLSYKAYQNIDNKLMVSDIPKNDLDIINYCNNNINENDKVFIFGGISFKFYWYIQRIPNYTYIFHTTQNEFMEELKKYINTFESKYVVMPHTISYRYNMREVCDIINANYEVCFENNNYILYKIKN